MWSISCAESQGTGPGDASLMTHAANAESQSLHLPEMAGRIALIVIGRNEGQQLQRAFDSLPVDDSLSILYVDSGSTDGSVDLASARGIPVHELDPASPFSAARARREGVDVLLETDPDIEWIQFLDGDCVLHSDWIRRAVKELQNRGSVAIVCGLISEANPESSIYNKMSPLRWDMPTGEILACGGIFMIRRDVYRKVGGFNPALITREERDLCSRVRASGHQVVRIDAPMAQHDSALYRFGDWWLRAVWGGYGDALGIRSSPEIRKGLQRHWANVLAPPVLIVGAALGMVWSAWFALALLLGTVGIGFQLVQIAVARLRQGDSARDAVQFSAFASLRNIAGGIGFLRYYLQRDQLTRRPDPRAGNR